MIMRKHGGVKVYIDGVKGKNHPHGKDYGLICTCISGSTKFPKLSTVFWILPAYKTTLGLIISTRQSRLSVVSRQHNYSCQQNVTVMRPQLSKVVSHVKHGPNYSGDITLDRKSVV